MVQLSPVQISHLVDFVRTSKSKNLLEQLVTDATKRWGSAVCNDALKRLSPYAQRVVKHMATPQLTVQEKVNTLPQASSSSPSSFDVVIRSVIALAALVRFDEYIQDARAQRGLRRQYDNATNMDLVKAIKINAQRYGNRVLADLISSVVAEFMPFVENYDDLKAAVTARLVDFRRLA